MKSTGIVRRVDELGRVVIPIELRNKFNMFEYYKPVIFKPAFLIVYVNNINIEIRGRKYE